MLRTTKRRAKWEAKESAYAVHTTKKARRKSRELGLGSYGGDRQFHPRRERANKRGVQGRSEGGRVAIKAWCALLGAVGGVTVMAGM